MTDQPKIKRVRSAETEWLGENEAAIEKLYPGMWIAVKGRELVAIGDDLDEVTETAKQKGVSHPLLTALKRTEYQDVFLIR